MFVFFIKVFNNYFLCFYYQKQFVEKHKANIKKYGMFRHYDDTQKMLEDHLELVCEETANYLVVWCIDLEMEEVKSSFVICFFFEFKSFVFRNIVLWNM